MHTFQNDIVIDVNRNHSCRRFLLDPIETRLLGVSHLDFEIALGRPCPKSWKKNFWKIKEFTIKMKL